MATILIGWELGGGLGHVGNILPVARALAARGHAPVLALRDMVLPAAALQAAGFPVLQAPLWPLGSSADFRAASFADILSLVGYGDAAGLGLMVDAWQRLIDLVRPALVLAEFAPTLCLAAQGAVPLITFGAGFWTPPADMAAFPQLQENVAPSLAQADMLAVVQAVQRRRGRPVPAHLPASFAAARCFCCGFPALDPYRSRRRDAHLAPLSPLPAPLPLPPAPKVFAYLGGDFPALPTVLDGLTDAGLDAIVHVRRPAAVTREALQRSSFEVLDSLRPLAEVLPRASLVLHHGGLGTTETALAAGRVQVIIPRHLEQSLTALALRRLGVGVAVPRRSDRAVIAQALRRAARDTQALSAAAGLARQVAARGLADSAAAIAAGCDAVLAGDAATAP